MGPTPPSPPYLVILDFFTICNKRHLLAYPQTPKNMTSFMNSPLQQGGVFEMQSIAIFGSEFQGFWNH